MRPPWNALCKEAQASLFSLMRPPADTQHIAMSPPIKDQTLIRPPKSSSTSPSPRPLSPPASAAWIHLDSPSPRPLSPPAHTAWIHLESRNMRPRALHSHPPTAPPARPPPPPPPPIARTSPGSGHFVEARPDVKPPLPPRPQQHRQASCAMPPEPRYGSRQGGSSPGSYNTNSDNPDTGIPC